MIEPLIELDVLFGLRPLQELELCEEYLNQPRERRGSRAIRKGTLGQEQQRESRRHIREQTMRVIIRVIALQSRDFMFPMYLQLVTPIKLFFSPFSLVSRCHVLKPKDMRCGWCSYAET